MDMTPGRAAFETHELASSYQWGSGAYPWDQGNPTSRLIWELSGRSAVEAANGTYTRPEFRLDKCPLHPGRPEVQIRRNGEWMCLQAAIATPEPRQLAAPPPSPEPDGTIVIGPECFASSDRRVISWRGINYYPWASDPDHQVQFAPEAGQSS